MIKNRFPGPAWTSTHVFGHSFFNYEKKLFYVNIPKCSSSWMKHYLDLIGLNGDSIWLESNFVNESVDDYEAVIILRDPIKRWLSQCPGNSRMNEQKFVDSLYQIRDYQPWQYDEHSALQSSFIKGIDLTKATFFYCDNKLSNNIKHFLDLRGIKTIDLPPAQNKSSDNQIYTVGRQTWSDVFSDSNSFAGFKKSYQEDYDLIDSVNFYRAGE